MSAYYNEINADVAAWLRQLIADGHLPDGDVDTRDIRDVQASEIRGYRQCHFFAGIGGWPLALRLAGWPDDKPVWTGSPPCQRFSSAARGRKVAADLRPEFVRLVADGRPSVVFGEQVADAAWCDQLCDDLEAVGYTVGAAVLPACGVGFDHARPRLFFAGHSDRDRQSVLPVYGEVARLPRCGGDARVVVPANGVSRDMVALAGFGNAIVPALAAAFVSAYMEAA